MAEKKPKSLRNKKFHIMFFIDAGGKTTLSFNLREIVFFGALTVCFLCAAAVSLFLYFSQYIQLQQAISYNKQLKSSVLAQALSLEQQPEPLKKETFEVVKRNFSAILANLEISPQALSSPIVQQNELAELSNNLQTLDNATISMLQAGSSPAMTQNGHPGEVKNPEARPHPKTNPNLNRQQQQPLVAEATTQPAPMRFQNFKLFANETDESNSQLTFDLVNQDPMRPLSGRVCGFARFADQRGNLASENIPEQLHLENDNITKEFGCNGGEFVKFSRLRPTQFSLVAPAEDIRTIKVFFAESASRKVYSYLYENKGLETKKSAAKHKPLK